jgi:hypothetical protein
MNCNNGLSCEEGLKFASYCSKEHFGLAHIGCATRIGTGSIGLELKGVASGAKGKAAGLLPGQGPRRKASVMGVAGQVWLRELVQETPTSATIDNGRRLAERTMALALAKRAR